MSYSIECVVVSSHLFTESFQQNAFILQFFNYRLFSICISPTAEEVVKRCVVALDCVLRIVNKRLSDQLAVFAVVLHTLSDEVNFHIADIVLCPSLALTDWPNLHIIITRRLIFAGLTGLIRRYNWLVAFGLVNLDRLAIETRICKELCRFTEIHNRKVGLAISLVDPCTSPDDLFELSH